MHGREPDRGHRADPPGRGGDAGDRQGRRPPGGRRRAGAGPGGRRRGEPARRRRRRVEQELGDDMSTDATATGDMTTLSAAIVMPYPLTAGGAIGTFLAELANRRILGATCP